MKPSELKVGQNLIDEKLQQEYQVINGTDLICDGCIYPIGGMAIAEIFDSPNLGKIYCVECAGLQDLDIVVRYDDGSIMPKSHQQWFASGPVKQETLNYWLNIL